MGIYDKVKKFYGMPVAKFDPEQGIRTPSTKAHYISADVQYGEADVSFSDVFAAFLADKAAAKVKALVVGCWDGAWEGGDSSSAVELLAAARNRLTNLQALFFGDITGDEFEISWIVQSDVSPLFSAYPHLKTLYVRGGGGLSLGRPKHDHLENLVIQSGGLGAEVVREIGTAKLPQLKRLELWLGTSEYGGDAAPKDVRSILSGKRFPELNSLGLSTSEAADAFAKACSSSKKAPLLDHLDTLDFSMGTLSDDGAQKLLDGDVLEKIKRLDVSATYVTEAMVKKLKKGGAKIVADALRTPEKYGDDDREYRYCLVSE